MLWRVTLLGLVLATAAAAYGTPAQSLLERGAPAPSLRDGDPLLEIDSLFYIDNQGLTRILVTLNEHRFRLVTDPSEAAQGDNAFLIPLNGAITFEMGALLAPDDDDPFDDDCNAPVPNGNNCIEFVPQGPDGADAEIIISDVLLIGQEVAFTITPDDLRPLPEELALFQSFPNPFVDAATITYTIPEDRTTGLPVSLVVFDVVGRRVRTLVDARQFPGTFSVVWDGSGGSGQPVPSGLYLARLIAGDVRRTIRLTRLH